MSIMFDTNVRLRDCLEWIGLPAPLPDCRMAVGTVVMLFPVCRTAEFFFGCRMGLGAARRFDLVRERIRGLIWALKPAPESVVGRAGEGVSMAGAEAPAKQGA